MVVAASPPAVRAQPSPSPGTLLNSQFVTAPANASAWRIRYISMGLDGKPIEITGVVIAPAAKAANRPVIAYAHGTSGVAQRCAPSTLDPKFGYIHGLAQMIAHGYVVAATDYPGLGSTGPHPYLVGVSEGRAVLDSVRAARHIAAAGASTRFITWGYSQGGHASLWAGQLASTYAPELHLAGIAAGAPPTDLRETISFHIDQNRNRVLAAYLLWSWSKVYHLSLEDVLEPRPVRAANLAATTCLAPTLLHGLAAFFHNFNLGNNFFNERMRTNAAWNRRFAENSPGVVQLVPYFLVQGSTDTIVPPKGTEAYAQRACANGNRVEYRRLPNVGHVDGDAASAGAATAWIAARFSGRAPPNNCR